MKAWYLLENQKEVSDRAGQDKLQEMASDSNRLDKVEGWGKTCLDSISRISAGVDQRDSKRQFESCKRQGTLE